MKKGIKITDWHTGSQRIIYRYAIYEEVQAVIQDEIPLIPINYVIDIFALDNNVVPDRDSLMLTLFEE